MNGNEPAMYEFEFDSGESDSRQHGGAAEWSEDNTKYPMFLKYAEYC